MRSQTDRESGQHPAARNASQRAAQAANLLHEALALLRADATEQLAHPIQRASDRLLRLPEVERLTGLRRSTIYEQMQRGVFPRSVKAGRRTAAWPESAVQSWIADRLNGRPYEPASLSVERTDADQYSLFLDAKKPLNELSDAKGGV
jgi:prophage regulatory protein